MDVAAYLSRLDGQVASALEPWARRAPQELTSQLLRRRVDAGAEFVRMLDRCASVYVLCAGRVRSVAMGAAGASLTLDEFDAPAVFGEMEAIAGSPQFHSSLVACTDCELLALPRAPYLAWLSSDAELMMARARSVTRLLLRQMGTGRSLVSMPSVERIMLVVYQEARRGRFSAKVQESDAVVIRLTHPQLAERAGVSAKTVSRALAELERRGLIERRGRSIAVDDDALGRLERELRRLSSPPSDEG